MSPDGRLLAYTQGYPATSTLVVRDLRDDTERRWLFPEGHEVQRPSWAPDSRHLAISDVAGADRRTVIFDTEAPDGAVPAQPSLRGPFQLATFRGGSGTLVATGAAAPSGYQVVEIDPSTGASHAVYTTPFLVKEMDADASGEHFLLVTDASALYVWSNGSVYQVFAGVLDAEWSVSR